MTSKLLFEAALIELNKENTSNLILEDFNHFINKAINQYINKRYNIYDISLQTTDDLRVLKATAVINVTPKDRVSAYDGFSTISGHNAVYAVNLPSDYLHMLNCMCVYKVNKTQKCYNAGETWRATATRLTADLYSQVLDNYWSRPDYRRPYYYIHNLNTSNTVPTDPYDGEFGTDIDYTEPFETGKPFKVIQADYMAESIEDIPTDIDPNLVLKVNPTKLQLGWAKVNGTWVEFQDPEFPYLGFITDDICCVLEYNNGVYLWSNEIKKGGYTVHTVDGLKYVVSKENNESKDAHGNYIPDTNSVNIFTKLKDTNTSLVEKSAKIRYGNVSPVRMEIRYGSDSRVFELFLIYIDYIKAPQHIRLTQRELDSTEDTSQMLEFPDYVCHEILNELVHILMENTENGRIQTHPVVTLSIANPTQQLTAPQQPQQAAQ